MHIWKKEFQQASGRFTQLIWKGSEEVGSGVANKGLYYFVVANYYPAANNVLKA